MIAMDKHYSVMFTEHALKQFKKLDRQTQILISRWIGKNLDGCTDPRAHGKGLTANRSGQWRYRIGDYRLICEIEDELVRILVLALGHRKYIYD